MLEAYGPCVYPKLRDLAVAAGVAKETTSEAVAAKLFIDAVRELNRKLGIPEHLTGIRPEDIREMAQHAAREANPLYPVPLLMDASELEVFYHLVSDKMVCSRTSAA